MADTADPRTKLNIFLQRKVSGRVTNTLFSKTPLMQLMLAINAGHKSSPGPFGLGRPKSDDILIGRVNTDSVSRRDSVMAERQYLPLIQTYKPSTSEVKKMGDYDRDPTVPNWDTTNATGNWFKQPVFKFARKKIAYKVAHTDMRTAVAGSNGDGARATKAVGSLFDVQIKTREGVLCESVNNNLFGINGENGYPANEEAHQWSEFHSLPKALGYDNLYAGLDRALPQNAQWRAPNASAQIAGDFEDIIDYCDLDLNMRKRGLGVKVIAVGKVLFRKAKREAKAKSYTLHSNGVPEYAEWGFKKEIVCIETGNHRRYVIWDPAIDDLDTATSKYNAFALDPATWTFIIPKDANFKVSKPCDQTENEGGDEADTGTIALELLMACEVPEGNVWLQDVAA